MEQTVVRMQRSALLGLVRGAWTEFWVVTPRIGEDGLSLLLPYLRREGVRVRVMTHMTAEVDVEALHALRSLPDCEVRNLPDLTSSIYAAGPEGPALFTSAHLTLEGLESPRSLGTLVSDAAPALEELERWWEAAYRIDEQRWSDLAVETSRQLEAGHVGQEIARMGAFVRVSVRGTRRTRRLDPREFGAGAGDWGRVVRPVEVALYKLDEVVRAREELERLLEENGLEWHGHYLVPRHFLEREWPRLFAARERQLRERLSSPAGQASLKAQLGEARRELEAFFGELYTRVESPGMDATAWVDTQVTRVLAETVAESVLEESGLEYRVLTILPEDTRSVAELSTLLHDPRLRSVQLTFNF